MTGLEGMQSIHGVFYTDYHRIRATFMWDKTLKVN